METATAPWHAREIAIGTRDPGRIVSEVTIGILAALPVEGAAMARLIDGLQPFEAADDPNTYRVGGLPSNDPARPHRIALAVLPRDGTRYAAAMCTNLLRTFPGVRCVIMMGIAGGIPRPDEPAKHVRLGDVVVATAGVVDYGHVRQIDGVRRLRRSDGQVSSRLLRAARELQFGEAGGERPWERWLDPELCAQARDYPRPDEDTDLLYVRGSLVPHPDRQASGHPPAGPKIHYGAVASSDVLMRDEVQRDELAQEFDNLIAVEMEGSGIAASTAGHDVPWFMVRGVTDYCDNIGKNDRWHRCAAYTTAAYVRALLSVCRPFADLLGPPPPAPPRERAEPALWRTRSRPQAIRDRRRRRSLAQPPPNPPSGPSGHRASGGRRPPARDETATESGGIMSQESSSTQPEPPDNIDSWLAGPDAAAGAPIWNLPPRNPEFTGRQDLLDELERRVRGERVTAVLPQGPHGMGGVGKSQLVIEYAHRHRADFDIVWWIPAEQPAQIQRALVDLGERLGLELGPDASVAVPAVREALGMGVPYHRWLLIFDNAEALEEVRRYFPTGATGRILVTARNLEWTDVDADALTVGVFTRDESVSLLRKHIRDVSHEEADALAATLQDLPLAVAHASAWLATTRTPVSGYLRQLTQALTEQADSLGYERPVAAAWNVALDRLGEENPGALQLLQVCSFFAPEPIGGELFTSPRQARISPELDETLRDPGRLNRAFRDIARYGLARIDHRDRSLQLHRLVKAVLVNRMPQEDRLRMQHGAHLMLAGGNPGSPDSTAQWQRYHALLPHVLASEAVHCVDPWARQLLLDVVEFHYYWGDHAGCRDLARQVVDTWRATFGGDDPQTLKAAKWLAFALRILGAFREAAEINLDCLHRSQTAFGPEDEATLDAMSLVAADLRAAGDFGAARELDTTALAAGRRAFGDDDPISLTIAHSLGVSLRLTGDFVAALEVDADTCRRRGAVLGEDHALTLLTLNGLILDMRECGRYAQAHLEHEKCYERFQRVWGRDHPVTFLVARNLAVSCRLAGKHQRGRKLAEDTMNRARHVFGRLHPETVAATLNYSVHLRYNDELADARNLAEQVWGDYETVLGARHPFTLYAQANLAIVARAQGDAAAAYTMNVEALELLRGRVGPDHILTLTCMANLAGDHAVRGDHAAARETGAHVLGRWRELLGQRHPATLAMALNHAQDLASERRYEEAYSAYARVLGEAHPAVSAARARVRADFDAEPMPL